MSMSKSQAIREIRDMGGMVATLRGDGEIRGTAYYTTMPEDAVATAWHMHDHRTPSQVFGFNPRKATRKRTVRVRVKRGAKVMRSITRGGKRVTRAAWRKSAFRGPHSESKAWASVRQTATRILMEPKLTPWITTHLNHIVAVALDMETQLARGVHTNPIRNNPAVLSVVGANPGGTVSWGPGVKARVLEIRYKRTGGAHPGLYRHQFKSPAFLHLHRDGSLSVRTGR